MRVQAILALLTTTLATAAAGAVSLSPAMDAFTSTANTNGNFGAGGILAVAAPGLAKGGFDSVLKFDFSAAKSSFDVQFGAGAWTLLNAALQVTQTTGPNPVFNSTAAGSFAIRWFPTDTWMEGTGTPNVPTADGISDASLKSMLASGVESAGTFAYNGGTSVQTLTLTLTPGMVSDVVSGALASFDVKANDAAVSLFFNSRSFGTASARPVLTLNAVALASLTAQQAWRLQYFGIISNTGSAADTSDSDKDGLPNLIEWACKLDPTTSSALAISVVRNGANLEFTYVRSVSAVNAGAVFTVEWSDTLTTGSWSTAGVSSAVLSNNGTVQTMKATLPTGAGGRRCAHLKVTAPP